MKPISNEKREMIVKAKKRGESDKKIMEWITGISRSTITRVWKLFQETGSYEPKPYTGRKSEISTEGDYLIRKTINESPDITLRELIEKLSLPLSESGLSRRLARMGLTYKKRHSTQMGKNDWM